MKLSNYFSGNVLLKLSVPILTALVIIGTFFYMNYNHLVLKNNYSILESVSELKILDMKIDNFLGRRLVYTNFDKANEYFNETDEILANLNVLLLNDSELAPILKNLNKAVENKKNAARDFITITAQMNNSLSYVYTLAQKINNEEANKNCVILVNNLMIKLSRMDFQNNLRDDEIAKQISSLREISSQASSKRSIELYLQHVGLILELTPRLDAVVSQIEADNSKSLIYSLFATSTNKFKTQEYQNSVFLFTLVFVSAMLILILTLVLMRDYKKSIELESFKKAIEISDSIVMITDINGHIEYVNHAFEHVSGYDSGQILGKKTSILSSKKYDESFYKTLWETILSGNKWSGELVNNGKDNRQYIQKSSIIPIGKNASFGFIAVGTDVTHERSLLDELSLLNQQLEVKVEQESKKRLEHEKIILQQSKMALMGEMIGAISHQWRQPLNSLALIIQSIEMDFDDGDLEPEGLKNYVSDAMATVGRMSQTIDDFRDFFKPRSSQESFNLKDAIGDALRILEPQLRNNNIEIGFDYISECEINGYKNELEQVVLIVLSNAQDALLQNNIKNPKINIRIEKSISGISVLSIQDNAGGVPSSVIDRIFEPYFTTKHKAQGTGIGLYMGKEIIERQMNGRLYVENIGDGARFVIEI